MTITPVFCRLSNLSYQKFSNLSKYVMVKIMVKVFEIFLKSMILIPINLYHCNRFVLKSLLKLFVIIGYDYNYFTKKNSIDYDSDWQSITHSIM